MADQGSHADGTSTEEAQSSAQEPASTSADASDEAATDDGLGDTEPQDTDPETGTGGAGAPDDTAQPPDTSAEPATDDGAEDDVAGDVEILQIEACIEYALAQCERRYECQALEDMSIDADFVAATCRASASFCPDAMFAPGTTRTLADLPACTEAWRSFDCGPLLAGELPACATPGTFTRGEACVFHAQCASGECNGGGIACGTCQVIATATDDCTLPGMVCPPEMSCGTTKRCEPKPAPEPAATPETFSDGSRGEGDTCYDSLDCVASHLCAHTIEGRVCLRQPALGEACDGAPECAGSDVFCSEVSRLCESVRQLGEPCDFVLGSKSGCVPGSVCDHLLDPPQCVEPPSAGQPCVFAPALEAYVCDQGATCDVTLDPPMCRAAADGELPVVPEDNANALPPGETQSVLDGEPCDSEAQCSLPSRCLCTSPECETKVCAVYALPGEPCSAADVACHPASRCIDGQCVITGRESVFDALCGG